MVISDLDPVEFPFLPGAGLVGVGWLGTVPSADARVSREVFSKLVELAVDPWQPAVAAGFHACEQCLFSNGPGQLYFEGRSVQLGVSNLYIPGTGRVYVAPSLILHYIDSHGYCPPTEFQQAVLGCPRMKSAAYFGALKKCGVDLRSGR